MVESSDIMLDIKQINPSKITADGYYFDMDNVNMFPLSDNDILAIRSYFKDSTIASNRNIEPKIPSRRTSSNVRKKSYKVATNQKYNDGKHRRRTNKNNALNGIVKNVVVGGIVLAVTIYGGTNLVRNISDSNDVIEASTVYYQEKTTSSPSVLDYIDYSNLNENIKVEQLGNLITTISNTDMEESIQKQWVRNYCDIYQVNFNVVYNRLVELTNNFTSESYLNGYIPGVTCKKQPVYAQSEEELILYFVRCAKQVPSQLGISTENLYIKSDYHSSMAYGKSIGYYGNLLGVDPFLMYAIVQSETGWDSPLFLESNNPAGLRNEGKWWQFDTKEEGFIELALEILKYNRMGAFTIEEIGSIHAPTVDPLNANWVPNVTMTYQDISTNHRDLVEIDGDINYQNYHR